MLEFRLWALVAILTSTGVSAGVSGKNSLIEDSLLDRVSG